MVKKMYDWLKKAYIQIDISNLFENLPFKMAIDTIRKIGNGQTF